MAIEQSEESRMNDQIDVKIASEPGSLVCLIGGSIASEKFDPWNRYVILKKK